jgi:hypothetical protein
LTRDAKLYGPERYDAACARALAVAGPAGPTRKSVLSILKCGLERQPLVREPETPNPIVHHEHIRGGDYYDKEKTS